MSDDLARPVVAVYREHLFEPTETFIYEQAASLRRWRPVFVGRERVGTAPGSCVRAEVSLIRQGFAARFRHVAFRSARVFPPGYGPHGGQLPALVHAHFAVDGVFAMRYASRFGVPLVVTLHGYDVTMRPMAALARRNVTVLNYLIGRSRLFGSDTTFLCVSEFVRSRALELGVEPARAIVHHIGSRRSRPGVASAREAARGRVVTVIHIARLTEKKGTAYLIRAIAELIGRGLPVRLRIVGDGELRESLECQARSLGVADSVEFCGQLSHVQAMAALSVADVLCLPSVQARSGDAEGLGMVLLEAADRNIPIVATAHGGITEFVQDGVTGLLCPERDADALATAIERLLREAGLARSLATKARALKDSDFDLQTQTRSLEATYFSVLGRSQGQVPR